MVKFFKKKFRKAQDAASVENLRREKAALIDAIKATGSSDKVAALRDKLERDIDDRLAPIANFRRVGR